MGAGGSAGIVAAIEAASADDITAALHGLSVEGRKKLATALGGFGGVLETVSSGVQMTRDLCSQVENDKVLELATGLMDKGPEALLGPAAESCAKYPPIVLEALYCAASKAQLFKLSPSQGLHLTVIFAMYKETGRIKPKAECEHGEDFLRNKVKQLTWLFEGAPANFSWDIVAVDDGCPDAPPSWEVAQGIIASEGWKNVRVLKLQDGIDAKSPVAKMEKTSDSRKGGAILYGLHEVAKEGCGDKEHIVLYTDSDLSANCAMSGLLCSNIVAKGHPISCGHRYGEVGSLLVKENGAVGEPQATGGKPDKMIIVFRHWARGMVIPCLAQVKDTQCGFKAFLAKPLLKILPDVTSYNETFDVDLLIRACTTVESGSKGIGVVPIIFTEDFAASTMASSQQVGGKLEPGAAHLKMVHQILAIRDTLVMSMPGGSDPGILGQDEALLSFLRGLDVPQYKSLVTALIEEDNALPEAERNVMFERTYELAKLQKLAGSA
eukprot:TRINITY_DN2383_c0_g1_i3.p1 TRINITY_DN2383_c0_g1~~TRINITY_DN2383_c0_g1_i3.p1  ORF type:complete len:494 (+),score=92.34 TRINITY_DN2383_c0_g1_i3:45-1526(+)